MVNLGFIGCGVLTEAIVHGLNDHANADVAVHLSPRSETRSRALANRYENVAREESNEAVVAKADIVFLAVRPQQMAELRGLPFREEQTVVSLLAGTPLAAVNDLIGVPQIIRVVPLPCVRLGAGPILMTPPHRTLSDLLGNLGDLIVLEREADLAAVASVSGLMSSHFAMQNVALNWLTERGVPTTQAALYVRSFFAGLGAVGLDAARHAAPVLVDEYETKGGLNEACRKYLTGKDWFTTLEEGLNAIEAHGRGLSTSKA